MTFLMTLTILTAIKLRISRPIIFKFTTSLFALRHTKSRYVQCVRAGSRQCSAVQCNAVQRSVGVCPESCYPPQVTGALWTENG
jgi:hypothetical protein